MFINFNISPSPPSDTLTDGQLVQLDANNRPALNYKGFVTDNTNGVWSVLCDDKVDFDHRGAEIAGSVCINLGFRGYRFFNKTSLSSSLLDVTRLARQSYKHIRDETELEMARGRQMQGEIKMPSKEPSNNWQEFEPILGTSKDQQCRALYVECVPFATGQHSEAIDQEDKTKILDLHPVIHPAQKPAVIVEPVKELQNVVNIRFPWMAEIYVNGKMKSVGILLEHYWVLATSVALDGVE